MTVSPQDESSLLATKDIMDINLLPSVEEKSNPLTDKIAGKNYMAYGLTTSHFRFNANEEDDPLPKAMTDAKSMYYTLQTSNGW